jgi:hypothetical protein
VIGKDGLEKQGTQEERRGSVGCSDFRQPAVNLLLKGSDFFHGTFL